MKQYLRTLTGTNQIATWSSGGESRIDIPRDYCLQRLILDCRGDIDLSSATLVEDAGQRMLNYVRFELVGGRYGNKTVVDISGVDLYFLNFYDNAEGLERVVPSANGTDSAVNIQLVIDFRLAKNDPDDYTVSIPLYSVSSATLIIGWNTIAAGYASSGGSNFAMTCKITLVEGKPESKEEAIAMLKNPLLTVTSTSFDCSSSTGEEERNTDIPTGGLMRRLFFFARNSSNARSDTEVDYMTLKKVDDPYFEKLDWDAIGCIDEQDYNLGNYDGNRHIKGLVCLDFARGATDERGRVLGEDWRGYKSGDIKLTIYKNNASSKIRYMREAIEAVA